MNLILQAMMWRRIEAPLRQNLIKNILDLVKGQLSTVYKPIKDTGSREGQRKKSLF